MFKDLSEPMDFILLADLKVPVRTLHLIIQIQPLLTMKKPIIKAEIKLRHHPHREFVEAGLQCLHELQVQWMIFCAKFIQDLALVMALIGLWIRLKGRVQVVVRCVFQYVFQRVRIVSTLEMGFFLSVFLRNWLNLFLHLKVLPTLSKHCIRPFFVISARFPLLKVGNTVKRGGNKWCEDKKQVLLFRLST